MCINSFKIISSAFNRVLNILLMIERIESRMKKNDWNGENGLPNSALIKGESFFLGCRVTGGGDGEQGGVGKLESLVMSSDCNHERLVNSASTSQSSLRIFSFILGESRFIRFSTSIDSPFIFTIFHRTKLSNEQCCVSG